MVIWPVFNSVISILLVLACNMIMWRERTSRNDIYNTLISDKLGQISHYRRIECYNTLLGLLYLS